MMQGGADDNDLWLNFHSDFENATTLHNTRQCNLKGKKLKTSDKFYIVDMFMYLKEKTLLSARKFAKQRGISNTTLLKWAKQYHLFVENHIQNVHETAGRPHLLDNEAEEYIFKSMNQLVKEQKTVSRNDLRSLVIAGAKDTLQRRGIVTFDISVSDSYLDSFRKKFQLQESLVQTKTSARMEAQADSCHENRNNKLAYSDWYNTLDLEEKIEEDKALSKGKKA